VRLAHALPRTTKAPLCGEASLEYRSWSVPNIVAAVTISALLVGVAAYALGPGTEAEREALIGDVHAPALMDVEVIQTLRGLVRGGKLSIESAEAARQDLPWLAIHRHPDASLLTRAWEVARP
jgi:hypothetical protein